MPTARSRVTAMTCAIASARSARVLLQAIRIRAGRSPHCTRLMRWAIWSAWIATELGASIPVTRRSSTTHTIGSIALGKRRNIHRVAGQPVPGTPRTQYVPRVDRRRHVPRDDVPLRLLELSERHGASRERRALDPRAFGAPAIPSSCLGRGPVSAQPLGTARSGSVAPRQAHRAHVCSVAEAM